MKYLFDLTEKIALITGASSGMGRAIAEAMGLHGARIIITSNDKEGIENSVHSFKNQDIDVVGIPCDLSKKEDIDRLFERSIEAFGRVDILVSGVGMAPVGGLMDIDADTFDKIMHLNLQAAIYLTQLVLPSMQAQKDGVLIYLASIAGVRGNKNLGLYGISKAGLIQLVKNLAVEYGPDNIRTNAISPGLINTPFSQGLMNNREFMQKRLSQTPLRKVGEVEEIAGVAVLLASKAGGFITRQNIIVDGGTTISDGN
ncbi:SDR family oxidoreductase [Runella sp.]|jgi:NAD(P)-dependent dehydrogenase (short-subunit alcohol dehydrogenase family)|uniref:SDR family NAD(P)-dependent oxidoreductase n=1 Tax=Runella sp. TaxID=1960881 RepID=UPI003015AB5B